MKRKSGSKEKKGTHPSANSVKCWDCDENPTERLKQMFVDLGQKSNIAMGDKPARRAVFRKQHGIAYGRFNVKREVPSEYKVGIFADESYECVVRFSSDTSPSGPDLKSTMGMAIKLFGVKGKKLLGEGNNVDFIFQNFDRFFVKDAKQMCDFTTAGVVDRDYSHYLKAHPKVNDILTDMAKVEASCLTASYWAILPFQLGKKHVVKYRIVPDDTAGGAPFDDNNYLAVDLQNRLRNNEAKFRFEIQLRTDDSMPIDDAQAVWSAKKSPYFCIAELVIPKQDICSIGQEEFGQRLSFNIWRTLKEHEPLGSIALARKVVYKASADARHQANGQSPSEPDAINPPFSDSAGDRSSCIVYAGIYPPIGVMRVGNSKEEYFLGPEIDDPEPQTSKGAYRDKHGAIKRQAARFRIYGFNAAGKAVKELTAENASITWDVHLANQKASWYEFQLALDIPEAEQAPPSLLRNNNVKDRGKLLIDGGSASLRGKSKTPKAFKGKFFDASVYLGEMFTDEKGRLIVLGGHGIAENHNGDEAITFANNEGWYDDISDGPVTATVEYEGVNLRVLPAWVVCAPPDYAPMQKSVRTMWDLMRDVAVKSGQLKRPARPSFTKDILPIFQRMTDLQWVNAGFAAAFGWGGQFDYTQPKWLKKLSDPSSAYFELRRTLSNNFRRYGQTGAEAPQLWPWVYGDAMSVPASGSERQSAVLSDLQLSFLDQWVNGDFDADYDPKRKTITCLSELPVHKQPDMLTKAAMDFCLADAFHPGCEMTWPMRTSGMYMAPFRLKHAKPSHKTDGHYYGPLLNGDVINLPYGPLYGGQVAGGITRWMAIPWHCDTASCRDGYETSYDPYLPTFWPARVPNNVLSKTMYKKVLDTRLSDQEREQSFSYREAWLDDLPIPGKVTYTKQINSMIDNFDSLGIVQYQKGVAKSDLFPDDMQVSLTKKNHQSPDKNQSHSIPDQKLSLHGKETRQRVDLRSIAKANRLARRQ